MKRTYITPELVIEQVIYSTLMLDTSEIPEGNGNNDWDAKGTGFGSWELNEDEE